MKEYPKLAEGNEWTKHEKMIWDMYYLSREHVRVLQVLLLISLALNIFFAFMK